MNPPRLWLARLAGAFRRNRDDREFTAELESNLEFHIEDNLRRGLSPCEARRQALISLGGVEAVKEAYRDQRGGSWLDAFAQDVRFALRMVRKNLPFTAVVVLTLALGIGVNTAIFSVVDAVLLRPLPFRDPDRLVSLWQTNIAHNNDLDAVSPANFLDWQDGTAAFDGIVAMNYWSFDYTGKGEPEAFTGELVSKDFFRLLGVSPALGRVFLPEEYEPGKDRVVLLSHGLWQRRFGSDPAIVGQTISLRDELYIVAGVLPEDFHLPWLGADREVFAPLAFTPQAHQWRTSTYLMVLGRLKPGVSLEQASAALSATASRLTKLYPIEDGSAGAAIRPLAEQMTGPVRPLLLLVSAAAALVLLIGCANVANLLLVRGSQRGRELAIRASLGAARARLMRQLLTESFVLCAAGCAGGLLLARWSLKFILGIQHSGIPRLGQTTMSSSVLIFGVAITLLTGLVFGLVPALRISRADLQSAMRRRSGWSASGSRQGLKGFFVISQVALALTLLVGAGLLLRSLVNLLRVDQGYSADHVVAMQVYAWTRYSTGAQRVVLFQNAMRNLSALPDVEAAGAASSLPLLLGGPDESFHFSIEGRPRRADQQPTAIQNAVTPGYFAAMGVPLIGGRLFNEFDTADSPPVVLINQTMARRYWPGEDPIGKHIGVQFIVSYSSPGGPPVSCEIVGIVGDTRQWGPEDRPGAEFFQPHTQVPTGSMAFVVRAAGDPNLQVNTIKRAIWAVDPKLTFYQVQTLTGLRDGFLTNRRLSLDLLAGFAAFAFALAAIGIYGVISYSTAQRTQEIGIRLALGAQRTNVLALILASGMRLVLAGVIAGCLLSLALTRLTAKLLYGVGPADPWTFSSVAAVLLMVAFAACYLPARRATRVDPLIALRYE
ncbi:MAG TPA: ABC transporter permease [Candidatus Acidoferrales bacterium]|nr:ABC transporter permease [Candidatus Acidoferrales bacterium]